MAKAETRPADLERAFHAEWGPWEHWTVEVEDEEQASVLARIAQLQAADEAVLQFSEEARGAVHRCPPERPFHALEVRLQDDRGAAVDAVVELSRQGGRGGRLFQQTDRGGAVRFEGLRKSDCHRLRVLGQTSWSITGTADLPPGSSRSVFEATWDLVPTEEPGEEWKLQPGECLWTLGNRFGLDPQELWNANRDLHQGSRTPHVLAPGDRVRLEAGSPPAAPAATSSASVDVGTRLHIECSPKKARARLCFQDERGEGRSGLRYVGTVTTRRGAKQVVRGTTDENGTLDEAVPADAETLEIILRARPFEDSVEPERYLFRFGHLDPVRTTSGIQGRLLNLGYGLGDEGRGEMGPLTRRALQDFQRDHGLAVTGKPDAATESKLVELSGI